MKAFFSFLMLASIPLFGFAQTMTSVADNDPAATKILDKLRKEYDAYKSMEVAFKLTLDLPEQGVEVQNGVVGQQGEKYFLKLDDQEIYCNGIFTWLYLKSNKEVQLNNAELDEDTDVLSPKDMLKIYDSKEFVYAITSKVKENGVTLTVIEFKPLDEDSEYAKLKMTVNTKRNKIHRIEVFSKDGSRYILDINEIVPNKRFNEDDFVFVADNYPGIHIEDLRID